MSGMYGPVERVYIHGGGLYEHEIPANETTITLERKYIMKDSCFNPCTNTLQA